MIDELLLGKAVKELKVKPVRRSYVLNLLREIGHGAIGSQKSRSISNPSALVKELKTIDAAVGRMQNCFGFKDTSTNLDEAFSSSKAITLSITNYGDIIRPDRYKHWPLDDEICRDRLIGLFSEIQILRSAVGKSIEEISGRIQTGRGGGRRKIDWVLQETAWHLLRLYFEETGRKPGVSKPPGGGQFGGPAVRFLNCSLKAFGLDPKPSTAADLINKLKSDPELPWNLCSNGKNENQKL